MSTLRLRVLIWTVGLCLLFGIVIAPAVAQTQSTSPDDQATTSTSKSKKKSKKSAADNATIKAAASESAHEVFQHEIQEECEIGYCGEFGHGQCRQFIEHEQIEVQQEEVFRPNAADQSSTSASAAGSSDKTTTKKSSKKSTSADSSAASAPDGASDTTTAKKSSKSKKSASARLRFAPQRLAHRTVQPRRKAARRRNPPALHRAAGGVRLRPPGGLAAAKTSSQKSSTATRAPARRPPQLQRRVLQRPGTCSQFLRQQRDQEVGFRGSCRRHGFQSGNCGGEVERESVGQSRQWRLSQRRTLVWHHEKRQVYDRSRSAAGRI